MNKKPILSIVTPTRGNFSGYWLEHLLRVKGDVELILAYPPAITPISISDGRVKIVTSPHWGEVMQRATGLRNATGEYVLALDDDDFVHPDIVELVSAYFKRFPDSWVLRLCKDGISRDKVGHGEITWASIPDVTKLTVLKKSDDRSLFNEREVLCEAPIAPLDNKLDLKVLLLPLFFGRRDHKGWHMENFVDRVWKNDLVQPALTDFFDSLNIVGKIRYIPPKNSFGFDRVMSLFLQAKFYNKGAIIGHWMPPTAAQLIKVSVPNELKPARFHVFSHVLLVKRFPQYGYLWNLFFTTLYDVPRKIGKVIKMNLCNIIRETRPWLPH